MFSSYYIVFEAGLTLHYDKQRLIVLKLIYKDDSQKLNSKLINYNNIYTDIGFDVIKRGPLLVLIIGFSFAILFFIIEVITVFIKIKY